MILDICNILESHIKENVPDSEVALLLSGGVDSLAIGFDAEKIGKKVHAYTFRLNTRDSADSRASKNACKIMNWSLTIIDVPTHNLERDVINLARNYGCVKKTQFETTYPLLYTIPAIKEKYILSGLGTDQHYGLSKKACIHYKNDKAAFDNFRYDYFFNNPNPAGLLHLKQLCEENNKVIITPYFDKSYYDYFIRYDWQQINKPREKYPVLLAYKEYFKKIPPRRHANYQLVAGIDLLFAKLLDNSFMNYKKRKRVMDMCRDLHEKYGET